MVESSTYGKLIERLKSNPQNIAILLVGKAAKMDIEDFYGLNDVDLVVIQEETGVFERQVESLAGLPLDISYIDFGILKREIENGSFTWVEVLATGKLVSSSNDERVADIISSAIWIWAKGPKKPNEDDIKFIRFSFGQAIEESERKIDNPLEFSYLSSVSIERMIDGYFELNGIWKPKHKKRLKKIASTDSILLSMLQTFYGTESNAEKLKCMNAVANHVLESYGGITLSFAKGAYPVDK